MIEGHLSRELLRVVVEFSRAPAIFVDILIYHTVYGELILFKRVRCNYSSVTWSALDSPSMVFDMLETIR